MIDFRALLLSVTKAADCSRRRVGALVVNDRGELVGTGWNGLTEGSCTKGDCPRGRLSYSELEADAPYDNCDAIHAEDSAMRSAGDKCQGATLLVTCEPCADCKKLIDEKGISEVQIIRVI